MWHNKVLEKTKYVYHCFCAITADEKSVVGDSERIPIAAKLKYMLLGFSKQDIAYYGFPKNDYRNYISTAERLKLEDLNGRFADILGEKVMLERIWGDYINVPKTYCLIERKYFLDLSDKTNEFDVVELLKNKHKLLAKPTRSCGGGHGVTSLSYKDGFFFIGSKRYAEKEFNKTLREYEGYLISDWITQHKYSSNVFPDSTNTIRVVTIMNHKTNKSDVLLTMHRWGTKQSSPVDNACSGGLFCYIDSKTGVCGAARNLVTPNIVFNEHPSTKVTINGLIIPNWNNIINKIKHVHNCFPYYEFLAWDIVNAENEEPYVIEINRGMDVHWLQIERPQRNDRVGKYMRAKGLLRKW